MLSDTPPASLLKVITYISAHIFNVRKMATATHFSKPLELRGGKKVSEKVSENVSPGNIVYRK